MDNPGHLKPFLTSLFAVGALYLWLFYMLRRIDAKPRVRRMGIRQEIPAAEPPVIPPWERAKKKKLPRAYAAKTERVVHASEAGRENQPCNSNECGVSNEPESVICDNCTECGVIDELESGICVLCTKLRRIENG